MAELDDRLKNLFGDDDGLKKVLEMAGTLMGRDDSAQTEEPQGGVQTQSAPQTPFTLPPLPTNQGETESGGMPNINQLLDTLFSSGAQGGAEAPSQMSSEGQSSVSTALPQLLQAFSGKSNYIDENRLNLIKAMKPYMATTRAGSVDRAIKMANMAKAAKMALGLLGR